MGGVELPRDAKPKRGHRMERRPSLQGHPPSQERGRSHRRRRHRRAGEG